MSTAQALARLGAVAAVVGAVIFFVSGLLHPASADPNDLPAAFAEYAASSHWVGIHLAQFVGAALAVIALVALAATLERRRARRPGRRLARRQRWPPWQCTQRCRQSMGFPTM